MYPYTAAIVRTLKRKALILDDRTKGLSTGQPAQRPLRPCRSTYAPGARAATPREAPEEYRGTLPTPIHMKKSITRAGSKHLPPTLRRLLPHGRRGVVLYVLCAAAVAGVSGALLQSVSPAANERGKADPRDKGPVGWDVYRQLDRLPELHTGVQTLQFSSFDRAGGNNDGFGATYTCLRLSGEGCVLAERAGPGEVQSIWFTRDAATVSRKEYAGNLRIELDGVTVLNAPLKDIVTGQLGAPFIYPLVASAAQSSSGLYIKVPMPYRERMRISTQNNPYFYHVSYRVFADTEGVSTFDPSDQALDIVELLRRSGTADPKPARSDARTVTNAFSVAAGASATLADLSGPGMISQLRLRIPRSGGAKSRPLRTELLRTARLRITFDGQRTVDAPLGEFFGSGLGEVKVRSLFYAMDTADDGWYSTWWPMPYRQTALVELYNGSARSIESGDVEVTYTASSEWERRLRPEGDAAYFRATSARGATTPGRDWVFLDVQGQGKFVGVTHTMAGSDDGGGRSGLSGNPRSYLEGDERVYVDGSRTPRMHGTGAEDFYEGAYYFGSGSFTAPMNGAPAHLAFDNGCQFDCTGAYRLMIGDAVPFHSSLRFSIEHGPRNDVPAVYGSTAYWYGKDSYALRSSDTLDVGDEASEQAHGYTSPDLGEPMVLTSVFEGDFDDHQATAAGRATNAPVSFKLKVDTRNEGILLRRMSDQANGYQAARVYVNDADAGIWLQPLGNQIQRWSEDFFQLPVAHTAGRTVLNIRLEPLDGSPPWHAARYEALSYVPPFRDDKPPSQVTGLVAEGNRENTVTLTWNPAGDNVGVARYQVYGSQEPGFALGAGTLLGERSTNSFTHADGLRERWFYRVRAVDGAGNVGKLSGQASGTTGSVLKIEAEALLPAVEDTAPAVYQEDCCGVQRSGGAQILFQARSPGDYVTLAFEVPKAGTYNLSAFFLKARDFGIHTVAFDSIMVGQPFDGYSPEVILSGPVGFGRAELSTGRHTITFTVTGKNAPSSGFFVGVDLLELELAD